MHVEIPIILTPKARNLSSRCAFWLPVRKYRPGPRHYICDDGGERVTVVITGELIPLRFDRPALGPIYSRLHNNSKTHRRPRYLLVR